VFSEKINNKLYEFANILIIAFGFFMTIDYSITKKIGILLIILWIITGDYKEKLKKIFSNKVVISFLLFLFLCLVGMLWTQNLEAGFYLFKKRPILFLIAPIIVSMYKKEYLKYFLYAVIFGMIYTSIATILIKLGFLNISYHTDKSPFINRVYLAGMLLFAYIYLLNKISFKEIINLKNIIIFTLIIMIVYSLVVSGSRMGYINFIIINIIFVIYKYGFSLKKFLIVLLLTISVGYLSYKNINAIKYKVNQTIHSIKILDLKKQIQNKDNSKRTSLTCRFEFWYYAYNIGKKYPILGVGTGDGILELEKLIGKDEAKKLFKRCQGNGSGQFNPHNMYLFMWMQYGIIGVLFLLWMLYIHFKCALKSKNIVFIALVLTTILTLFSLSELITTVYYIPFYAFTVTILSIFYKERIKI
jgi:O-antigen ligase